MEDEQYVVNCSKNTKPFDVTSGTLHQDSEHTDPIINNDGIKQQDHDLNIFNNMDGSFGLITDDVIEHCIIPFVEYKELILTIPLVCSKWNCMANKQSIWFDIVLKETKFNPINLTAYVNNCKYQSCKIKKEQQEQQQDGDDVMMNDNSGNSLSSSSNGPNSASEIQFLLYDDVYILKRLLYIITDYFPTTFVMPSEEPVRTFHQKELISRDSKNPNLITFNKRSTIQEHFRAFVFDMNIRSNKRIPNLPFKPTPRETSIGQFLLSSSSASATTPIVEETTTTNPSTTTTPPIQKPLSSNYLLEELVPIFYFEVETMVLEKPEPITPTTTTPLSSVSSSSANSFWKKITKKKVKHGRNSIGVMHNNYLGNRQVGWDDLSAGFHTDDGGIFLEEGGSKFKVDMQNGESIVVGDVLGCGFSSHHKSLFFTRNGQFLTSPIKINTLKEDMRFGLGFWKNMIVKCNFGLEPFKYDITKAADDINHYFEDHERLIHHLYDSEMTYSDENKFSGLVQKLSSLRDRIDTASRFLETIQQRIAMRELGIDSDEEMTEEDNNDRDYELEEDNDDENDDDDVAMELSSVDSLESEEEEAATLEEDGGETDDDVGEQLQEDHISEEEGSFSD